MTTRQNQTENNYSTKHPDQAKDGQTTMQNQNKEAQNKVATSNQKQDRKDAPQRGKDSTASH